MRQVISTCEAYRRWAESFDSTDSPIIALESRHLASLLGDVAGKRLIDVGCGTGRWLVWTSERGARVAGADFSLEMLRAATNKPGIAGRIVQADGRRLPFRDASAEVVLCTLALGHMQPVREAMAELARLAAPGGMVIVSDFHPEALRRGWKRTFRSGPEIVEIESEPYALADLANDGLCLVELREFRFGEPERPLFEKAGKGAMFAEACALPAIVTARFLRRVP
jgi:malonyl-CoA O-methyltransferase